MSIRLKLAFSAAVILVALGILSRFLHWMNQPSDFWLYAGAFGALGLVVLVPAVVGVIWRAEILNKRP
jgi:heme/copper-type cytochrome/quinol oxidase subunit 4